MCRTEYVRTTCPSRVRMWSVGESGRRLTDVPRANDRNSWFVCPCGLEVRLVSCGRVPTRVSGLVLKEGGWAEGDTSTGLSDTHPPLRTRRLYYVKEEPPAGRDEGHRRLVKVSVCTNPQVDGGLDPEAQTD